MSDFESKLGRGLAYGLGTAAAGATAVGIAENQKKYEAEKAIRERTEEENRKKEPSGGDNKSTGSAKAMKKGGKVRGLSLIHI